MILYMETEITTPSNADKKEHKKAKSKSLDSENWKIMSAADYIEKK